MFATTEIGSVPLAASPWVPQATCPHHRDRLLRCTAGVMEAMEQMKTKTYDFPLNKATPLKSNIGSQNHAMFEAGDTFSKAHHFWYLC